MTQQKAEINAFGTAVQGNMALVNTRGDGGAVGKYRNWKKLPTAMTDYTIFRKQHELN